ncbi:hypothetical protein AVEN_148177-1 [Araneus ventricosus]|uniref:Uncharacterized protein n=1 Tax=Araneus ventricosus TaxID=182803 RepID=A0A4Y2H7H4_ARAVE|nr:hypothetical protein AVEN_242744-1 [Araneus ventricosus]GBM60801.1 hypothetical protein AVEN_274494-1 [Araneus ventricosus]GBM60810.1 hypothetical protein AVEN_40872-1 [Araneus ventricosus]GBM60866.1 hypothetical protein AVEN_148177-1 [Araneus ventricosus]
MLILASGILRTRIFTYNEESLRPSSRASASIWMVQVSNPDSTKDPPCTLSLTSWVGRPGHQLVGVQVAITHRQLLFIRRHRGGTQEGIPALTNSFIKMLQNCKLDLTLKNRFKQD